MPKISIVITSYHQAARPYLDLCMRSIANLNYPAADLEVLIVTPKTYRPEYAGARTISPPELNYGMPRGLNFGMHESTGEHMLVLNDDVMLTRECLSKLMAYNDPSIGLLMPMGNDSQGRYHLACRRPPGPYRLEDLSAGEIDFLMSSASFYEQGLLFADTLCLYAFMIRREAFAKVGDFDEKLIGQDDIDYSLRSRGNGYVNAIAIDAVVYHAGGASNVLTDAQRAESLRIFNEKWGGR